MQIVKKPLRLFPFLLGAILLFSCNNDAEKIKGRWLLIKRISPQGNVVDNDSPFNFMENYVIDFNNDGKTLNLEYDSKGLGKRHGQTHRQKAGEWKIEQSKETGYPYSLTLRIASDDGIEETLNKVKTLSTTELIFQAQDNFIWYFEKK